LPEPTPVPASEVSRIEIRKAKGTVLLVRADGGQWRIEPSGTKADAGKVDDILEVIADLDFTALVSESEAYDRYDLGEDRKISVKAWAGDDLVREFSVGKVAPSYKHTFVGLAGDPRVYHASGSFRFTFDQTTEGLRDKQVLAFEPKDIRKIAVQSDDTSTILVREEAAVEGDPAAVGTSSGDPPPGAETRPVWKTAEGKSLDAAAVNRLLTTLSDLDCSGYLSDREASDFDHPLLSIRLAGSHEHLLEVFPRTSGEEGPYPAVSSMADDPFELGAFTVENLMEIFREKLETVSE
jgi:hypothetical protein